MIMIKPVTSDRRELHRGWEPGTGIKGQQGKEVLCSNKKIFAQNPWNSTEIKLSYPMIILKV